MFELSKESLIDSESFISIGFLSEMIILKQ